jgi:hypothetical protein
MLALPALIGAACELGAFLSLSKGGVLSLGAWVVFSALLVIALVWYGLGWQQPCFLVAGVDIPPVKKLPVKVLCNIVAIRKNDYI